MKFKSTIATETQRHREKILIRRVLLPMLAALFVIGCTQKNETETKLQPIQKASGVATETVRTSNLQETVDVSGTVRARTSAMVSTRIPGVISVLKAREGDRVKKGQLLIQLDAQENQATAAVATAGIEEAQRAMDEAGTRKKLADSTFERYQQLYKEQAISRQEFDIKQTERDVASQAVARAQSRIKQAQQSANAATTVADYTKIVAPISGVIVSKQADLGSSVFPGQPIMTIEGEGSYQLELAIPESMVPKVHTGMPLQVALDSLNTTFTSKITEIVPSADPASRTFTAKISLTQKGLKSGMFGRGALGLGTSSKGIVISKTALVERGALVSVWVIDKEKIAHMRLIKQGKQSGDKVEVLAGLSDGERIAIGSLDKITEGAKVE